MSNEIEDLDFIDGEISLDNLDKLFEENLDIPEETEEERVLREVAENAIVEETEEE